MHRIRKGQQAIKHQEKPRQPSRAMAMRPRTAPYAR